MKARLGFAILLAAAMNAHALSVSNAVYLSDTYPQFHIVARVQNTTAQKVYFFEKAGDTNPINMTGRSVLYKYSNGSDPNATDPLAFRTITGVVSTAYVTFTPSMTEFGTVIDDGYATFLVSSGSTERVTFAQGQHTTLPAPEISSTTAFSGKTMVDWSIFEYTNVYLYGHILVRFGVTNSVSTNATGAVVYTIGNAPQATATNVAMADLTDTFGTNYFIIGTGSNAVIVTPAAARTAMGLGTAATSAATDFAPAAQGIAGSNAQARVAIVETNSIRASSGGGYGWWLGPVVTRWLAFDGTNLYYAQSNSRGGLSEDTYYRVWDDGNDGTGSGMDADLLDGLHASEFSDTSTVALLDERVGTLETNTATKAQGDLADAAYPGSNPSNYVDGAGAVAAVEADADWIATTNLAAQAVQPTDPAYTNALALAVSALQAESDPLYSVWVTNSAAGSTNAILPDGTLVDISGQLGGGGSGISAATATGIAEHVVGGYTQAIAQATVDIGVLATNKMDVTALDGYWQNPANATNWTWTSDGNEITLTGYTGPTDVVIPAMLDGLPVTGFGSVFTTNASITSISGAANVSTLVAQALYQCTALTNISLPAVTHIGESSISRCDSLLSVSLPVIEHIGAWAFNNSYAGVPLSVYFSGNAPTYSGTDIFAGTLVTNFVLNPQATGWGATFPPSGEYAMPVVRMGVTADKYKSTGGGTNAITDSGLLDISGLLGGGATNITAGAEDSYNAGTRTLTWNTNAAPPGATGPQGETGTVDYAAMTNIAIAVQHPVSSITNIPANRVWVYSSATALTMSNGMACIVTTATNTTWTMPVTLPDGTYWVQVSKPTDKSFTWTPTDGAIHWYSAVPSGTNLNVSFTKYGTNWYAVGGGQ